MEANLTYLRREVLKYERDPAHKITPYHIQLRMCCVVKFGAEVVRQIVSEVCQQLFDERRVQICSSAERVKKPLLPEVEGKKKSSMGRAKSVRNKKTSTTSRLGYRGQTARR